MKIYREMSIAGELAKIPALSKAESYARDGNYEGACAQVLRFLEDDPDPRLAPFAGRLTVEWMVQMGKIDQALERARECVAQGTALWGITDERTLVLRNTEMYWTGQAGHHRRARSQADQLVQDALAYLPDQDQLGYAIRNNAARIYETDSSPQRAMQTYRALLDDFESWGDQDGAAAFSTRHNYAQFLRDCGQFPEALRLLQHQLLLLTQLLGESSNEALYTRHEAAVVSLLAGDADTAVQQWEGLWRDCEQYLEPGHALTIEVLGSLLSHSIATNDRLAVVDWCNRLLQARSHRDEPELRRAIERLRNQYLEQLQPETPSH